MDASSFRKIEIFEPFSRALDLTKLTLFQPFDLAKWFVIGFAAFLAHLGGGGNGFNYNPKLGDGDWKWKVRSATNDAFGSGWDWPAWLMPLIVIGGLLVVVLVVVCLWLGARGRRSVAHFPRQRARCRVDGRSPQPSPASSCKAASTCARSPSGHRFSRAA